MTIKDMIAWLRIQLPGCTWYNGKLYGNDERCIVLYERGSADMRICIGGMRNTTIRQKPIQILVHWGKSSDECERKAGQLHDLLAGASGQIVGGERVIACKLLDATPIDLGTDENGIFERTIRAVIY